MSIIDCFKCERRIDSDYEEIYDYECYIPDCEYCANKVICCTCKEIIRKEV